MSEEVETTPGDVAEQIRRIFRDDRPTPIIENGRLAGFTILLPNGQHFRIQVEES